MTTENQAPASAALTTPEASAAPAAQPQDSAQGPWNTLTDPSLREYATTKGWKAPDEALKAMKELEASYTPPASADAYKLPVAEGDSGEFAKTAATWFHEAGVTQTQAEKLAAKWNEFAVAQQSAQTEAQKQAEASAKTANEEGLNKLRAEWPGEKYDENVELGRRAVKAAGVSEAVLEKLYTHGAQDADLLKMFAFFGKQFKEGTLVPGGGGTGAQPNDVEARARRMYPSMKG